MHILAWGLAISLGLCWWLIYGKSSGSVWLKPSTYILRKKYFADGSVRYSIEYGLSEDYHLSGCESDDSAKILYDDFCGRHQRLADSLKVEKEEILK